MMRPLMALVSLAAVATVAGAQTPTDSTPRASTAAVSDGTQPKARSSKPAKKARSGRRRYTSTSSGEVMRSSEHAVARDWVRADSDVCDDLCQHEKMMDARYGKDRERRGRP